jgi:serine/threonine-protein kinase
MEYRPDADVAETAIRGTPAYMSPEQASGRLSGPPSDVFSLGILLFEMLTARHPYADKRALELLLHLQAADVAAELVPQLEPVYHDLLASMLQSDPELRPAAREVVDAIASLRAQI